MGSVDSAEIESIMQTIQNDSNTTPSPKIYVSGNRDSSADTLNVEQAQGHHETVSRAPASPASVNPAPAKPARPPQASTERPKQRHGILLDDSEWPPYRDENES